MRVEGINKFDEPAHPFVVCPVSLDGGALAGMAFVNVSKNADEKVVVFLFFLRGKVGIMAFQKALYPTNLSYPISSSFCRQRRTNGIIGI